MRNDTFYDVAQNWLIITKARVSFTTYAEYERALKKYFFPKYWFDDISQISYEELVLYLATFSVSAKTFNNIMIPLRGVFEYAKRIGLITDNIVDLVETRQHQRAIPDPLEVDEVFVLFEFLKSKGDLFWLTYFVVAIFTGLRPSEQIALKWSAVDFRRGQIMVSQARVRARVKTTKTQNVRFVDLQSRAEIVLREHFQRTKPNQSDYVFINPRTNRPFACTGHPLEAWNSSLKDSGIRARGAKQSRHTFATICLHAGMNPAYVSRQMGHSNAKMFFEVYSRWIDGSANSREKAKMDTFLSENCL